MSIKKLNLGGEIMKKFLAYLMTAIMILGIVVGSPFNVQAISKNKFVPSVPDFRKADPDLKKELGVNLKGKELRGYNGKAYMKPGSAERLEPTDVKGLDHKGIAILVDFPLENNEGKISDVPGVDYERIPKDQFNNLLNGTTYNPYELEKFSSLATYTDKSGKTYQAATDRTMRNYYTQVSNGQFQIDVEVVDWVTLPKSYDYYLGQNKGYNNENGDAYIGELISDAIDKAVENGVDFSQFAVDAKPGDFGDLYEDATSFVDDNGNTISKIVPNIFIIHRGTGAEFSTDPGVIWSHKWDILSSSYFGEYYRTGSYPKDEDLRYKVVNGVVVNTYNICPEVGQDITGYLKYVYPDIFPPTYEGREPSPADPGVYAHEFGHVLGLPDQYDYGYDSEGTGVFTLMASGSSGRDIPNRYYSGFCPVNLDAWSKYYLGFANPIEIKPEDGKQTVTLAPSSQSGEIYKLVVPGSDGREYFLIENRQQENFDKGLSYSVDGEAVHGLVVYHIDENVLVRNFHRPNEAANWDWNNRGANFKDKKTGENHYAISVVQADGSYDMEKGNNDGDAGDLFPGKVGITELNPEIKSSPNTISFYKWGTDSRSYTGIGIENIKENEDGTVEATIYFAE